MAGHCHKLVAKVAREAAGQLYETLMSNNVLFAEWKRQNSGLSEKELEAKFVATRWGLCIDFARATLAQMLQSGLDDNFKEDIMEALILDATLRKGRAAGVREIAMPGQRRER